MAEQFEDLEQQTTSATLGMWTFLGTEFLFVGIVFVGYLVCRTRWPEAFAHGSKELKHWLGWANTGIIMTTSFTVTLALRAAKLGNNRHIIGWLATTLVLGLCFLSIKGTEYFLEAEEGLVPGINFTDYPPSDASKPPAERDWRPVQQRLFMIFYYILTAIHAFHMTVGMFVLTVMLVLTWRGHFSAAYHSPIECAGMYWHFVDMVWIMIFSSMYLLFKA